MSLKPVVGYWSARGLCQPIRLLLAYEGVDFEDVRYSRNDAGKCPEWFDKDKPSLGLDFPNIPYYIDENVKLSQSIAIMRYLARKYKLEGTTEVEKTRIDVLEQHVSDLSQPFYGLIYGSTDFEKDKQAYLKALPDQLKPLSTFLGSNQFAAGNKLTYVDFWFYEYLIKIMRFAPEQFAQFENLKPYVVRVESQPKLAAWLKRVGPQPFVGPGLKWNDSY